MTGALVISEDEVWSPAGWVFDSTVDLLVSKLLELEPELAQALMDCRSGTGGSQVGELDLRGWNRRELNAVARAVDEIHAQFRTSGPASVPDTRFFSGFMGQLGELRGMLHSELARQWEVTSGPGRLS